MTMVNYMRSIIMNKKLLAAFVFAGDVADHMEQWLKVKGLAK